MNRQTRFVFYILISLIGLLAASTTFFATRSFKGDDKSASVKATASPSANIGSSTAAPTQSSQISRPASSSEKPSKYSDTYTVQKGETLFSIAQTQGISGPDLAEANGITDANKIQAGQALIIPKGDQVNYTVDQTRAASLQKDADAGKYQFRLDPVETARSDAPSVYALAVSDNFTIKNKDAGKAQVQATHESKNYLITLVQPITAGDKGIWAIESVRPI